jgi:uncharacterized protein YciI
MKIFYVFVLWFFMPYGASAQSTNPNYDSDLAGKLGADEYGMKMYIMVILKTGPNNVTDKVKRDSLFAGHQNNIRKLVGLGKLIVAGPIETNDRSYRGIFILDVQSFEEANALLEMDPTIKQQVFETELYKWYGSAALPEYLKTSDKIWKKRP